MKNRSIKLRAWDKNKKWMIDDLFLCFNGSFYTDEVTLHDTPNKEIEKINNEDFIVMEFTGITDKNGIDVYEGDILKFEKLYNRQQELQIVSFQKFMWITQDYNFREIFERNLDFEVIGNIYNNTDLLVSH